MPPLWVIKYGLIAIAMIAVVSFMELSWCNVKCRSEKSHVVDLTAKLDAARARATYLANLWASELQKGDQRAREKRDENEKTTADFNKRIAALSARPSCSLSGDATRVLDDITRRANDSPAAPRDQAAPQAVPAVPASGPTVFSERAVASFANDAADAYRDAMGQWFSCVNTWQNVSDKSKESQ